MEVTRELVLPAAPDEVWQELTDPERLEEWFASEVELDLEEGKGHFRWENGEERHAVVETVEEGRRLGYTWSDEEGHETHVDFTIEETDEGTRVVVTETAPTAEWGTALELRALVVAAGSTFLAGRAKTPQAKDAGSPRILCDTGATEDAGMRRFAAGQEDNRTFGRGHVALVAA